MVAPSFVFFGTPKFATNILDELEAAGHVPAVIVTAPDKPQGRHLVITPPPARVWADKRSIPVLQPSSLKTNEFIDKLKKYEPAGGWDIFIVAAYGKIIPLSIIDLPKHKTLNVHPSLLPHLRGASPVQSAILEKDETGVTIMRLDEKMDHGPIVAQKKVSVPDWPPPHALLEEILAREGGKLLAETIIPWTRGELSEREQDHSQATYCRKIEKEDAKIDLEDDTETNLRKIRAFADWPKPFFIVSKNGNPIRIIIKDAEIRDGNLHITRIVPEGRKEMNYDDFMKGL